MPTKEVMDQYLKEVREKKSKSYAERSMTVLNAVSRYESEIGKAINTFSDNDFQKMFEKNNWIGMSNVTSCKSRIVDFMKWDMLNNNAIYNVRTVSVTSSNVKAQDDYGKRYFESEEDFLRTLQVFSSDERYYRAAAICALYWIGLSQKEAIRVKKSDVDDMTQTVAGRQCPNRDIYDIIKNCAQSTGYTVLVGSSAAERKVVYVGSELILRQRIWNTGLSADMDIQKEQLTPVGIGKILREVNLLLDELPEASRYHGVKLAQKSIFMSSKFCKMYDFEVDSGNPNLFVPTVKNDLGTLETLQYIFPEENWKKNFDNKQYYRLIEYYRAWKEYFHK